MTVEIIFSHERHIGLVELNRPQALNALNLPMIQALQQQLQRWQADDNIYAVVVKAEGEKAFCAGGDVRHIYHLGSDKYAEKMQFFWHEYRLNHYINQFNKPYIALMDGITMGGGVGISLQGSHPVASERFVFAMPETSIGFFPDIGASHLLARCPGQLGVYLGLTGERLNAQEAYKLGLVKQVVPSEKTSSLLIRLLATDLSKDAHQRIDSCLQEFAKPVDNTTIENQAIIDRCFAQESVEKIFSSLQNEKGDWAQATLENLAKKSPLSLKVTLAQLRKAKSLSMAECIKMDYCLVSHFMRSPNFYEGVRALLIDKDKSPHWQPDDLALISEEKVASYFECDQGELALIV